MNPIRVFREPGRPVDPDAIRMPRWFQVASRSLLLIATVFLFLSIGTRVIASNLIIAAIAVVCLAIACVSFLYAQVSFGEHKRACDTQRELSSIFHHVLDGILILNDEGTCLDANPAAFAILAAPPPVLVGRPFAQFFEDPQEFEHWWRVFLARSFEHGQTELCRPNGSKVIVNYTLTANYLPGRHAMMLCDITERVLAQDSAREMQNLYQRIADSIDETFWLLDASTKEVIAVTRGYETITGRPIESIAADPASYQNLIHPEDRARVLAKLDVAMHSGRFDEEFRIVRPDGAVRWVWAKGSSISSHGGLKPQLYGTALDITGKKNAEAQVAEHLLEAQEARAEAERAGAEAEALRKATLALTQNLRMDAVLDTLLETLHSIVPNDIASVILTEEDDRLFVAREWPRSAANGPVVTIEKNANGILERVVALRRSVYVPDTRTERDWREHRALAGIRSWMAVPLVVSDSLLGLLSVGNKDARAFTMEQLHLAKLLAIPAAVAIHNARLYEWAQIYAAERRTLLKRLDEAGDRKFCMPRDRFTN